MQIASVYRLIERSIVLLSFFQLLYSMPGFNMNKWIECNEMKCIGIRYVQNLRERARTHAHISLRTQTIRVYFFHEKN